MTMTKYCKPAGSQDQSLPAYHILSQVPIAFGYQLSSIIAADKVAHEWSHDIPVLQWCNLSHVAIIIVYV